MPRAVMLVLLLALPAWGQTPGPTVPIGQQYPRERFELPVLTDQTPMADTAAVGIDFAGRIVCLPVQEMVQGRLTWVQRCTVPSPTP